jgi:hypothetical protein
VATRIRLNAGSWAGAWGQYWAGSWGEAWGYDAGGNPILVEERHSGGPDSNSRGRSVEREEKELEHLERQAEHGRRMYAQPVEVEPTPEPVQVAPPVEEPVVQAEPVAQVQAINTTEASAAIGQANAAIDQLIADRWRKRREEEAFLLTLLAAVE